MRLVLLGMALATMAYLWTDHVWDTAERQALGAGIAYGLSECGLRTLDI